VFPIQNGLKQGDALLKFILNFASEYIIRYIQEYKERLGLNGTHQFMVYAYHINIYGENKHYTEGNRNSYTS